MGIYGEGFPVQVGVKEFFQVFGELVLDLVDFIEGHGGRRLQGLEIVGPAIGKRLEAGGCTGAGEAVGEKAGLLVACFGTKAITDAGREVVGFVDEEEDAGGRNAFLFEEQGVVAGGEDVVEVADEYVGMRKGGAGDFVRADTGLGTKFADFLQSGRPGCVEERRLDAGALPFFFEVAAAIASVAGVEGGLDGVFLAVAELEEAGGAPVLHSGELLEDLVLAGGFSGEDVEFFEVSGLELFEGVLEGDASLAKPGWGFQEEGVRGMGEAVLAEFIDGFFLAWAPGDKGGVEADAGEAFVVLAADAQVVLEAGGLGLVKGEVARVDGDCLHHAFSDTDKGEFAFEVFKLGEAKVERHGHVGLDLCEIGGVMNEEFALFHWEVAGDGLDLPDGMASLVLDPLVDLAGKFDLPAVVVGGGFEGFLEGSFAGCSLGVFAEVVVPLLADGSAPAGRCGGSGYNGLPILELGEFADVQLGEALLGVDEHAGCGLRVWDSG